MANLFKKILFYAYTVYEAYVPIHTGTYQVAQILYRVFGLATFTISGFKIELNPVASIDRRLILGLPHDEVVGKCVDEMTEGTFLDIGANIGYFSLQAASRGIPVFAFEPSPREVIRLNRNISINNFSNITVFQDGISTKKQELVLHLGQDFNPGQNSLLDVVNSKESVLTTYASLADFLSTEQLLSLRLCKIDVEGYELTVLQGMESCMPYLTKCTFVIEVTPKFLREAKHSAEDVYNFFEKYGYTPKFGLDVSARKYDEVFSRQ